MIIDVNAALGHYPFRQLRYNTPEKLVAHLEKPAKGGARDSTERLPLSELLRVDQPLVESLLQLRLVFAELVGGGERGVVVAQLAPILGDLS